MFWKVCSRRRTILGFYFRVIMIVMRRTHLGPFFIFSFYILIIVLILKNGSQLVYTIKGFDELMNNNYSFT